MKKFLCFLLLIPLCLTMVSCNNTVKTSAADDIHPIAVDLSDPNRLYFEWSDIDNSIILGYTELGLQQTELTIPDDCSSVVGLNDNPTVKKIIFEGDDTEICKGAFSNCTALEEIRLPENLLAIAPESFSGCSALQKISVPDNVSEIGYSAFSGCESLETVTLNCVVKTIGDSAFASCSSLNQITIPSSISEIGDSAFKKCSSLSQVDFEKGIKEIGDSAFRGTALVSVNLPDGVKKIGKSAFYTGTLKEIVIPKSVRKMYTPDSIDLYYSSDVSIPYDVGAGSPLVTVYVAKHSWAGYLLSDYEESGAYYNIQYIDTK